jgi:hypothetical protein
MDFFADDDYFARLTDANAHLANVKRDSTPSIAAAASLSKYLGLQRINKNYMEDAIHALGEPAFVALINLAASCDFSKLDDSTCTNIFGLYSHLLLNSHINVINTWIAHFFSPLIWLGMSKLYLKNLFTTYPKFIDEYATVLKQKHSAADLEAAKFMSRCLGLFGEKLTSLSFNLVKSELLLCEKILEFLLICVSTPQSRLATIQIMQDRQFYIKNKMFLRFLEVKFLESEQKDVLANLQALLQVVKRFINFDIMGESRIAKRTILVHYDTFQEFQKLLFHYFHEKVEHYVIKSVGSADTREKLMEIFSYLTEDDLRLLANKLNIFVPEDQADDPVLSILTEEKGFKVIVEEILIFKLKSRQSMLSQIKSQPLFPTQNDLWSPETSRLLKSEQLQNAEASFAVDRVTAGFVNLEDYLIRHFHLWCKAFALDLRRQLDDLVPKLKPAFEYSTGHVSEFKGWSPLSVEAKEFTVFEVEKAQIGKEVPEHVLAEVIYSTVDINTASKQAWEKLKSKDSLFLLAFKKDLAFKDKIVNELDKEKSHDDVASLYHLDLVRGCELISHMDEDRNKINVTDFRIEKDIKSKGTKRFLQIHMDPYQYALDMKGQAGTWSARNSAFNVVVKREIGSPNFKAYLELVTRFLEHSMELPDWLVSGVVGKTYNKDIYLSRHSFYEPVVVSGLFGDLNHCKKVIDHLPALQDYRHLIADPHPSSSFRSSSASKLSDRQLEASLLVSLPGISLVEGGPSTGKLRVAVECVRQALANNPEERVLIVTRSPSYVSRILRALATSITEDQLIRLDQGDRADMDFSRFGRVNFILKRRLELLEEAELISTDVGLELHAHLTCETADILFKSQIASRWTQYLEELQKSKNKQQAQLPSYPFCKMRII